MTKTLGRIVVCLDDLSVIRELHRNETIVLCSGAFDLTHAGHVLFFEDCKKLGDVLVVEVAHDALIRKHKGVGRPIQNESVRLKMVSSLIPVDYCFLDRPVEGHPFSFFDEVVFPNLRPDKFVLNQDAFGIEMRQDMARRHGVELVVLERRCPPEFENISTSGIIKKIQKLPVT